MKKIALLLSVTISLFALDTNDTISEQKADKILLSIFDKQHKDSDILEQKQKIDIQNKIYKKMKLSANKELSDEEINQIFLSFYDEWRELQKKKELELQNAKKEESIPHQAINTASIDSVPSLEEQMREFQKNLMAQHAQKDIKEQPKEVENIDIFGTSCNKDECKLITQKGYRYVGDSVNGKVIDSITRFRVTFDDGTKIKFIIAE